MVAEYCINNKLKKECCKCNALDMCLDADKARIKDNVGKIFIGGDSCVFCKTGGWEAVEAFKPKKLIQLKIVEQCNQERLKEIPEQHKPITSGKGDE
jgi:hypothetical protein